MGQPPKRAMAHPSPGHVSGLNDRYVRLALALVVAAGGALAGWTYRLDREVARLHAALRAATTEGRSWQERVEEERRRARAHRRSLEDRIETTRRREGELRRRLAVAAGEAEVEAVRAELRQLQWRLVALEGERAAAERIIRDYGAGVCLIHASYAFYDANGRPLRYRVDASGQKVREADGSVAVQVGGSGPVHSLDAVGTGFLADRRGRVVTNRHVVEPWWKDKTAESLAKYGYEPRLLFLHVFFPGVGRWTTPGRERSPGSPSSSSAIRRASRRSSPRPRAGWSRRSWPRREPAPSGSPRRSRAGG
jgi:hypothetical protein